MEVLNDDAGRYRNGGIGVFGDDVENMFYDNQTVYYEAIAASTAAGQSVPFIDFMLKEISKALQQGMKEPTSRNRPFGSGEVTSMSGFIDYYNPSCKGESFSSIFEII